MTEAAHDNHDCARFSALFAAFKKKIIDTSVLVSKYTEVTQENERLRRQLQDAQQLTDTLHGDCDKYKQEACAALTQIDPLKQCCKRLQAEVNLLSQQKQELQLAVNCSQATLKQYENLVEAHKHQERPESTAKPNEGRNRVLFLKKKLEERNAQLKQTKRSLREAGLEMKQMRTRCKSAVERAESLGKRLKERGVLGRREDRFVKRIVAYLGADAEAASSTEDESEAERDARHLEELLTANVYEEASICDVEEIFAEMRLPALLEPLSPDPVPKPTKKPSPDATKPELPAPQEPVSIPSLRESPVPYEQASSMKGPELEHPKPFPSVAEPQSSEQSELASPASPSRPELQSPLNPELVAPPKPVPVEKQPELLGSLESITHATQPGSAAQPKPAPLEARTGLGALPEPILMEEQPEAPPQPGLPGSLEPLACAEQSHSLVSPKPVPPEMQTELGASPGPVLTETQPGLPESLEPLACAEQSHSLVPPKPVPLDTQTELGASPEPVLMETQPRALTPPGLVDSPKPVSCAREQDLLAPLEPVPPKKQTELEASSEPVLIATKLGASAQLLTVPFVTQPGLPEPPSLVATQTKLPAGVPASPEPHLCAAETELREASIVVPRAVQPELETPPPPPPEPVLHAVKAELPVSSSVCPHTVQPEFPPETPMATSLAMQQAAPEAGSAITPPALRDPTLLATQSESPAPPKAVVPLVTEAELQATSSDSSTHVSHLKLSTSPQPISTSPASNLLLSVQPQELPLKPSRVPSPQSSSPVVSPSKESLVLPELSWEFSPEPSSGSLQEPPPELPPKQSLPEPPPPEQSQGPPHDTLGTGPSSRRQVTNAQVVSRPESLEFMLYVQIPKGQLDQLGKFVIGLDVAQEIVKVSCEGEAVPTVSLQTSTPAILHAARMMEERVDRPALGCKEKARQSSEQHWEKRGDESEVGGGRACRQQPEEEVPPLPAARVSPRQRKQQGDGGELLPGKRQGLARSEQPGGLLGPKLPQVVGPSGGAKMGLAGQRPSNREQPPNQQQEKRPLLQQQALPPSAELLSDGKQQLASQQPGKELAQGQAAGQSLGNRQGRPHVVGPWSGPSGGAQHPLLTKMRLARERPSIGEQPPNQQQEKKRPLLQQQALPPEASPPAELLSEGKQQLAREKESVEKPVLSARQQAGKELAQGQAAGQSLGNRPLLPKTGERQWIMGQPPSEQQQRENVPLRKEAPLAESSLGAEPFPRGKPWLARERQTTVEPLPSGSGQGVGKESVGESPQQLGPKRGLPVGSQQLPRRPSWLMLDKKQQEAEALMEPQEEPSGPEVLPLRKQRVARVKRCVQEQQQQQQQRGLTHDAGPAACGGEEEGQPPGEKEPPLLEPAPVLAGPKMKLRSASRKPCSTGDSDEELKREMQLLDVRVVLPRCTQVPGRLPARPKRMPPQGQQAGTGGQSQPPEGPLPRKRPRLDKQQLRELFAESGDSDEEEAEVEEGAGARRKVLALSQDCAAVTQKAGGGLVVPQVVRKVLTRLSSREAVQREALASVVGGVARDRLVLGGLAWLERTQANPQAAFCRGEQAPPLVTHLESVLVRALALYPGGQRAMLSAVRARLWSPRRPPTLHAQASYVRLACSVCRELREPALARVLTWDLLGSSQAPFLVAAAVGAWPRMLTAFPKGPVRKTLSYVLLHSPVHSLNSTLVSQAHQVLRQLGPLAPVEDSEQQLAEELLRPLVNPHRCTAMLADACLMHRLALEELCRRSPGGLLPWLLCQRVAPQLAALAGQPQAGCILRLLGYLSRLYLGDIATLEPLLQQLEVILLSGEPALQQLAVSALLRVPKIESTRWRAVLLQWRQEKRGAGQQAHPAGLRASPRTAGAQAMRKRVAERPRAGQAAAAATR